MVGAPVPERQLVVSWSVARPISWWPRQIPSTGTRPRAARTTVGLLGQRRRVAGPVGQQDAVVARELVRVADVGEHGGRAPADTRRRRMDLDAVVDDGHGHASLARGR